MPITLAEADPGLPVYVASRASIPDRSLMWRNYRSNGWNIVSTWIDEAGKGQTDDLYELWTRIEREISAASGLILYAESDDFPLKGALIEVGIAIGMGKPVAIVLPNVVLEPESFRPLGSWILHPKVHICVTLASAFKDITRRAA